MRPWFRPAFAGAWFGPMSWFAWFGRRRWHKTRGAGARSRRDADALRERVMQQVAARLGLRDEQRPALAVAVTRLQAQREALRGAVDWGAELRGLVQDGSFDRWRAHDLLQARVQALREHGPQAIDAMAVFYDGLDAPQQERVRAWLDRWAPSR